VLAALAIGPLTVGATAGIASVRTGQPLNLGEEWAIFLFQMAMVSLPFLFIAAVGARSKATWITGLAMTFFFWGWLVLDALTFEPGRGANIGLGFIMLVSPIVITVASLAVWARVERDRVESD
jgi:hypothetical protein